MEPSRTSTPTRAGALWSATDRTWTTVCGCLQKLSEIVHLWFVSRIQVIGVTEKPDPHFEDTLEGVSSSVSQRTLVRMILVVVRHVDSKSHGHHSPLLWSGHRGS